MKGGREERGKRRKRGEEEKRGATRASPLRAPHERARATQRTTQWTAPKSARSSPSPRSEPSSHHLTQTSPRSSPIKVGSKKPRDGSRVEKRKMRMKRIPLKRTEKTAATRVTFDPSSNTLACLGSTKCISSRATSISTSRCNLSQQAQLGDAHVQRQPAPQAAGACRGKAQQHTQRQWSSMAPHPHKCKCNATRAIAIPCGQQQQPHREKSNEQKKGEDNPPNPRA